MKGTGEGRFDGSTQECPAAHGGYLETVMEVMRQTGPSEEFLSSMNGPIMMDFKLQRSVQVHT